MNQTLRDIQGPLSIPGDWAWLWIVLGLLAGVGVIGWITLRYFKRPSRVHVQPQEPVLTPWQKTYGRLEDLRSKGLMQQADLKPFYIELSDIIRRYLEERFSLRAPEMTTEEFLDSLKTSSVLNSEQKQTLKEFLMICDMVKFAKLKVGVSEAQQSFDLVKQLIDQTHGI